MLVELRRTSAPSLRSHHDRIRGSGLPGTRRGAGTGPNRSDVLAQSKPIAKCKPVAEPFRQPQPITESFAEPKRVPKSERLAQSQPFAQSQRDPDLSARQHFHPTAG